MASRKRELKARMTADLILQPDVSLLCKLASIAIHAEEMLSPAGHAFDRHALEGLLKDPELKAWLRDMDGLALIPKKRV